MDPSSALEESFNGSGACVELRRVSWSGRLEGPVGGLKSASQESVIIRLTWLPDEGRNTLLIGIFLQHALLRPSVGRL